MLFATKIFRRYDIVSHKKKSALIAEVFFFRILFIVNYMKRRVYFRLFYYQNKSANNVPANLLRRQKNLYINNPAERADTITERKQKSHQSKKFGQHAGKTISVLPAEG